MKVPELPEEPVDGFTIEFWTYEPVHGYAPGPRRHLRIFVLNETWRSWMARPEWQQYHSHRPGETEHDGAPWNSDWMCINQSGDRMQLDGRSEGWRALMQPVGRIGGVASNEEKWAAFFATRAEAVEAFRKDAERYIAYQQERVEQAKADLAAVLKREQEQEQEST